MYSVLFSKIEFGMDLVVERLKEFVKPDYKVAIFPWAFPNEITSEEFEKEYFPVDGRRYNPYEDILKQMKNENKEFDLIFLDPPYKSGLLEDAIKKILEYVILIRILEMTLLKLSEIVIFYFYLGEILKCFLKKFYMIRN